MRAPQAVTLAAAALLLTAASAQVRVKPLLALEGETSHPSLSPDGKTLLFTWCKPEKTARRAYLYRRNGRPTLNGSRSHDFIPTLTVICSSLISWMPSSEIW